MGTYLDVGISDINIDIWDIVGIIPTPSRLIPDVLYDLVSLFQLEQNYEECTYSGNEKM